MTPIDLVISHYRRMGWIDDGRVLVRELPDPGDALSRRCPWRIPADFAILPVRTRADQSYELALSPDGRRVAYATANGLAIADVAGPASAPVHVDVVGAAGDAGWPSWSPDGQQVVFAAAGASGSSTPMARACANSSRGNIHAFDDPWQPVPSP